MDSSLTASDLLAVALALLEDLCRPDLSRQDRQRLVARVNVLRAAVDARQQVLVAPDPPELDAIIPPPMGSA